MSILVPSADLEAYEVGDMRGDYTFDGTHMTVTADGEPETQRIRVDFADNGDLLLHVKSSIQDTACAQPQGEPVKCVPPPPEEEIRVVRFRRVGDAMPINVDPQEKTDGDQPLPVPPPPQKKGDVPRPAPPPVDPGR